LEWVAFEPNSPRLWSSVKREVSSFLTELWREGAFMGAKPSDAFFVTCDSSNNLPGDIQKGILNVTIGIAPLRPSEFVIISINKTTSLS
jgi:phage tail sheath protein FI